MDEFRFVISTKEYEATVAFYRDGLGLPISGGWDRGQDDRGTLFQTPPGGIIEVVLLPPEGEPRPPSVVFGVKEVDGWYHRAQEKGLPIQEELIDRSYGYRAFDVTDPNGLVVTICTPLEGGAQSPP
jgi:catechol 2,3-dioxygenase-like lactoylglutathione lyase family enzyme